jgi:hypothetical protein
MSKNWIEKIFCCGSKQDDKRHIPTPSRRQIQLWEAREIELKEIRKNKEQKAENER